MKITRRLMALLLALSLLTGNVITPVLATETAAEPEVTVEEIPETVIEEEAEEVVDETPDEEPADEEIVVEETAEEPVVNEAAATQLTAEETDPADATEETDVAGATEENPLYPEWVWNDAQTEATATVTVPGATTYYVAVIYAGLQLTVNDGVPVTVTGSRWEPYVHVLMNGSAEETVFTMKLTVPVGTQMNPEVLDDFGGGYAPIAENSEGYYYTYTAEGTGYITASIGDITAGVEGDIILDNLNTYANRALTADGIDGAVTMAVTEGDVINIHIVTLPDENWNYPAAEIYWSGAFSEYAPGTEENPIFPNFQWNDASNTATATVTVPVGTSYYGCWNSGMLMSINGGEPELLVSAGSRMPAYFTLTNDGEAAAVYTLTLSYPEGTMENPAALADGETTAALEAGSQGYYYTYTAADRGTVTVAIDAGELGWTYVINNMTSYAYGDTQWSDSDPVVNPAVISVNKGDELQIMVNTYDAENPWSAPAGNVTVTVSFEAALGSESNPELITFTMNEDYSQGEATVTVPANTTYYCQAYSVGGMMLSINGEDKGVLEGNPRMPVSIVVTNDTAAEAVYTLVVSYPMGSQMNPEVLEYLGGYVAQEEGDTDGYYYTYTADSTGYLSAYFTWVDEGIAGNISLTNNNTYEQLSLMYDGVNGMVTMAVTEGDVISINVAGMPADGSWGAPACELGWTGAISADLPGTETNPLSIDSLLTWNEDQTEATATVTVPAATTSYFTVSVGGMLMSINGEGAIALEGSRWMPESFTITNDGTEAAEYILKITYPAGSVDNPEEITDGEVSVELAADSQGYYYTYTAYERGDLTIAIAAADAEGNELGWTYVVNNMTTYAYGDTQWSDSDPVVNPYTVSVNKGDQIQIMVNTYDPDNKWSSPAGTVTVTTSFAPAYGTEANPIMPEWNWNDSYNEATATVTVPANTTNYYSITSYGMLLTVNDGEPIETTGSFWMPQIINIANDSDADAEYTLHLYYPVGSPENPQPMVIGTNSAVIEAGDENGYNFGWTATESGVLVFTMETADGWTYSINNLTKGLYGDTQWSDEGSAVSALYVREGDEIQIMVNTYDPENPWSAPAGTIEFSTVLNPSNYEINSGKTLTIKFVHPETGNSVAASKVNWEIAGAYVYTPNNEMVMFEDASAYATISAGKLKTKVCGDHVQMIVKATLKADESVSVNYYVEIFPASTKLSIWTGNEPVVGGWTWNLNGLTPEDDPWWDLDAYSYPSNSKQDVVWSSSNKKVVTVDKEGVLRPVAVYNKAGEFTGFKTGSTTISVKTLDGTKKASFKLTVTKYATWINIVSVGGEELVDIPWSWHYEWNEETQQEEQIVTEYRRGAYVEAGTKNLKLVAEVDPTASKKGIVWECFSEYAKISSTGSLTVDAKAPDGHIFSVYAYSKDYNVRDEIIVSVVNDAVSVNIYPDYENPNFIWESETKGILDVSNATEDNIPSLTLRGWVSDSNGYYVEDISNWTASGSKNIGWEILPYWETGEWVDGQWVNEIHYDMENQPEGYNTYYSVVVTPKWNKTGCYTGSLTLTGTTSDGKNKASYKVTVASLVSSLSIETKDGKNMGTDMVWDTYSNWNPETGSYDGGWYEGPVVYATAGQTVQLKAVTNANATNKNVNWWAYSETFPDAVKFSKGKLTIGKDVPVESVIWVEAQAKDQGYLYTKIPVIVTPRVTNVHLQADFDGCGIVKYVSNITKTWDYNDGDAITLSNMNYPFDASQDVKWSVSNSKIGTVEEVTNEWGETVTQLKLTGNKFGKLTVTATATDGSKTKSSFTLNVIRSVQDLVLYDDAVAAGKTLKLAGKLGINPYNATNKKMTWTMTLEDGSAVPKALATLNKSTGVLTTKAAAAGTTVVVTATANDGYGATVTAKVRICKPTTSVDIMDVKGVYSGTEFEVINKKTVTTTEDAFYFVVDCKPSGDSAGMFMASLSNYKNYAIEFRADEEGMNWLTVVQVPDADGNVKYGKVKLTVKAQDGTNKSSYIYVNFAEPTPET